MSWNKKRVVLALMLVVAVAALAVAIAACGGGGTTDNSSSSAAATGANVKWGEMNSLTGVSAAPAKTLQNGYDEEVEYINANGGINGGQIDSISLDDKSDMSASVAGVTQLINQDKVSAIIGPFPQMVATAARSISEKAGTPHMLYAPPTLKDLTDTSSYKWSFLCTTGPDGLADALLVAAKNAGYKNVVAIGDVIPIHQETLVLLKQYAPEAGIEKLTVLPDKWDLATTDISPIVAKLAAAAKAEKPDALFILSNPIHVPAIQKGLKALNVTIPVIGSPAGTSPAIFLQGPQAVEGYTALGAGITNPAELPADYPGKDDMVAFADRYMAKYNQPPDFYAGFAYDAVHLMANAQTAAGDANDKEAVRTALENTKDWAGCQGVFTYSATDHIGVHGGLCLWTVKNGQFKLVEPLNPNGLVIIPMPGQ